MTLKPRLAWLAATLLVTMSGARPGDAAPQAPAMSAFVPFGPHCSWVKIDPATYKKTVLASFDEPASLDSDSEPPMVAWSPDARTALVWFRLPRPMLYRVDAGGTKRRLPLPPGALRDIGYDRLGRVTALVKANAQLVGKEGQLSLVLGGKRSRVPQDVEGTPILAQALRLEGGTWKAFETTLSREEVDLALGVKELKAADTLGYRSEQELDSSRSDGGNWLEEKGRTRDMLTAFGAHLKPAGDSDGDWRVEKLPAGSFAVWSGQGDTFGTYGRIAFLTEQKAIAPEHLGFTGDDRVCVRTRGRYLLVSSGEKGRHPRMYDLTSHQLVFEADEVTSTVFWPTPGKGGAGDR